MVVIESLQIVLVYRYANVDVILQTMVCNRVGEVVYQNTISDIRVYYVVI